jgi:membrane-associated phospholipid phosphatase
MTEPSAVQRENSRSWLLLAGGGCLLVLAAVFAGITRAYLPRPPTTGLDEAWLRLVTQTRSGPLTGLFKVLSLIGGPAGGTVIVAVICLVLLLVGRWRTALYLAIAEASGSACSQLVKHVVLRHRPPHPLVTADLGSFPSGHVITTLAVGLALTVAFARPGHRRYALAAVALATAIMMFARTYLAAHWLSDTVESVLIAGGLGLALWWIFEPALARERGQHRQVGDGPGRRCDQAKPGSVRHHALVVADTPERGQAERAGPAAS